MKVTLYHGTSNEAAEEIQADGELLGPVYMTPSREVAERYVFDWDDAGVIVEISIDIADLSVDMETRNDVISVEDAIGSGAAVFSKRAVSAAGCKFHHVVAN